MVAVADAAADPGAVVVHLNNTLITYRAMVSPGRLRLIAYFAHSEGEQPAQTLCIVSVTELERKATVYHFLIFAYVLIILA